MSSDCSARRTTLLTASNDLNSVTMMFFMPSSSLGYVALAFSAWTVQASIKSLILWRPLHFSKAHPGKMTEQGMSFLDATKSSKTHHILATYSALLVVFS